MRLNGETKTLKEPVALSDFLTQEGFSDKRIAVERNGEIVPKGEYANVILSDSDTLDYIENLRYLYSRNKKSPWHIKCQRGFKQMSKC